MLLNAYEIHVSTDELETSLFWKMLIVRVTNSALITYLRAAYFTDVVAKKVRIEPLTKVAASPDLEPAPLPLFDTDFGLRGLHAAMLATRRPTRSWPGSACERDPASGRADAAAVVVSGH